MPWTLVCRASSATVPTHCVSRTVASRPPKSGPLCSSSALGMTRHRCPEHWRHSALPYTLPDGRTVQAQATDASAILSTMLNRPVVLERARSDPLSHAEIDPAIVFGNVPVENVLPGCTTATMPDTFPLPPATFFDAAPIHILVSGTLAHLRTVIGEDAQLDPRRFRPNIFVDTIPKNEGFLEDGWLEGTLEVGKSVQLVQMQPTLRCVMTSHRQSYLVQDLRILRAAVQHHRNHIGVWASIGTSGTVHVGDSVMLVR